MIILEGPDGGGKTTLAKAICERWPELEYRRPPATALSSTTGPGEGLLEWWLEQVDLPPEQRNKGVYDRCFWISDTFYQIVEPRRPLIEDGLSYNYDLANLINVSPVMIFCLPDPQVAADNYNIDPQKLNYVTPQQMFKVAWAYYTIYALWKETNFNSVFRYDFNTMEQNSFLVQLEDRLNRRGLLKPRTRP